MNRIDKDTIATEILNITILIVGYFIYKNFNIQNIFQLCLFICYQICLFMFLNKRSYFRYFFKNLVYIFYGVLLIKNTETSDKAEPERGLFKLWQRKFETRPLLTRF